MDLPSPKITKGLFSYSCLFLFLLFSISGAEPVNLSAVKKELGICPYTRFFEDTSGLLTLNQVRNLPDSVFKHTKLKTPIFGFTKSVVWAKMDILNNSDNNTPYVLEIAVPSIHTIELFHPDSQGYKRFTSGFLNQGSNRALQFLNPSFLLSPQKDSVQTFFLKASSSTPLILPMYIKPYNSMHRSDSLLRTFLGLYFGALLVMSLYHLFLFPQLHDRSYLYYVLFVLTFAVGQMAAVYGFLIEDFFPGFTKHGIEYFHMINFTSALFAILFSRNILATSKYVPQVDKIILGMCISVIFLSVISPFLDFRIKERILVLTNIIPSLLLVFASIAPLKQKYRPAVYYIEAVGISIFGLLIYNFMYGFNLIPFSRFVYFIPNITFLITVLLFSIAQADRIRIIKVDRERAQLVALKNLKQALAFQEQKNSLEEELFHARKMEALGRLIGGISHDLRNMLTPFFGYPQLIKNRFPQEPVLVSYSEKLMDAAQKAKDLTSKLLNFSCKGTHASIPVDLKTTVTEVADILTHSIQKDITIHNDIEKSWIIIGDSNHIQNAVLNLALNAKDAMPQGGDLFFTAGQRELTGTDIFLRKFSAEPGKYFFVSVKDTGVGMDTETMDHLFEPFFTTKEKGKGTGLGLANVYGCVKSHSGCIEVTSEKGEGTTFTLFFPEPDRKTVNTESEEMDQITIGNGSLLLVDDDKDVSTVTKEVLCNMGYSVTAFNTAAEALEWFETHHTEIDLAVLDMIMPKKNGHELFADLRRVNPELKGIIVTGYSEQHDLYAAKKVGISEVLEKPYEIATLSKAIARHLRSKSTTATQDRTQQCINW
ncbi:MAG: 7TM diverse intracellular signaling domain-containing protein [Fibrobacterota bacterium]